jgi:hypothetical protein
MNGYSAKSMKIPETPPDDSSIDDKANRELFTNKSIEEISVKFGFHKDFPLRQKLEDKALDYLPRQKNTWVVFGTGNAPSA